MNSNNEKMLDLCFAQIKTYMADNEDLLYFKNLKDVVGLHHTIGGRLRNELQLWHDSVIAKWFQSLGIHHSDDMSSIILKSFHRKLNDEPINLEEQVQHYKDWWAKPEEERYG